MAASLGYINAAWIPATDALLNTREIRKQVTDIYNEEGLVELNLDLGNKVPVKQGIYYNFINDPIFKVIDTTGATVTNSGTRTVTITSITAATSGHARPGDLVLLAGTTSNAVAMITSVTPGAQDTIIVKGVSGANITITAGDKLSSFSVVAGENSDSRQNIKYGMTSYFNKVQIFRETSKITDVENATTLEVTFGGQPKIIVKDQLEKRIKLDGNVNAAFIVGDVSDTLFTDASPALVDPNTVTGGGGGGAVQTTRGLDKYITSYSTAVTVAGALGTVAITDIDTMCDALLASRAPKQYLVSMGSKARRAFDVYLQNLNNSGLTSVRMNIPADSGKSINTEVTTYKYGSFEFNFSTMPILDHPTMFAAALPSKSAYFIPLSGRVKTVDGTEQPNMQIRYFPKQTVYGSDMIEEYHNGGNNPINPTGSQAAWIVDYKTTQGLEVLGAQFFGRMKVTA
jgi:hypothetical protein